MVPAVAAAGLSGWALVPAVAGAGLGLPKSAMNFRSAAESLASSMVNSTPSEVRLHLMAVADFSRMVASSLRPVASVRIRCTGNAGAAPAGVVGASWENPAMEVPNRARQRIFEIVLGFIASEISDGLSDKFQTLEMLIAGEHRRKPGFHAHGAGKCGCATWGLPVRKQYGCWEGHWVGGPSRWTGS